MVNPVQAVPAGYKLIWSDEFQQTEGTAPDAHSWVYAQGNHGWGNQELENYTDHIENAYVTSDPLAQDGKALVIKAIKQSDGTYTSARINTSGKFEFTYGWVEARMKLPWGQGIWPAFWLLGSKKDGQTWPGCGEIDVMENIGKPDDETFCHGTIHGPGYSGDDGITTKYSLPHEPKLKDDYHVYAMEWSVNRIDFYLDGHLYKKLTPADLPKGTKWVYDHPFFIILNLAVGGKWPGYPDSTTTFPQTFMIDYVRVYQRR